MERVVALIDDLFFQMKVAETAKHLGMELKVAANGDALLTLLESGPKLVIVDLNARSQPIAASFSNAFSATGLEGFPADLISAMSRSAR